MNKFLKKNYLRILTRLLIFAAIILLLILLFGFVDHLLDKLALLMKHTGEQATQIHNLTQEVHSLELAKSKLESVITYQQHQIQELKVQGNTMSFDFRPKEVTMEDLHNEIEPQLHTDFVKPSTIAATILSAIMLVKGTIGTLAHVLP
jgi:Cu/Ag efflux protein CusF